jgi:hypothetical protein
MADRTNFTPAEWRKLLESPIMAGHAVTAADPSGLWGQLKEKRSGRWTLLEAKTFGANELIRAVAPDFDANAGRTAAWDAVRTSLSGSHLSAVRDKALASLREVAALVDAKAPDEAAAFKDWLKQIAQKTAEAAAEGGFLGFGGVQVSDAEKATLAEIVSALAGSTHSALSASTPSGETPASSYGEEEGPGQVRADLAAASAPGDRVPGEERIMKCWDRIPAAESSLGERMRFCPLVPGARVVAFFATGEESQRARPKRSTIGSRSRSRLHGHCTPRARD